jgi:fused signal recognition particle receptor
MFSFFRKKPPPAEGPAPDACAVPAATAPSPPGAEIADAPSVPSAAPAPVEAPVPEAPPRGRWFGRLRQGLRKTGSSIAQVFTGTRIDDALYEELESALLMADAGVAATSSCWPT